MVPVTVASVIQKQMPIDIRVIGTVEAYSVVSVHAQITGQLTAVNFKEGEDVKKDQVLFTLDRRPLDAALLQAQANLQRDIAQAANARVVAKRYEDLAGRGIATTEQLETNRASAAALDATVDADRAAVENAKVQLQYATIASPISGRTGTLMVHEGNLIRAADTVPLIVINQVAPVYVSFGVPEARLNEVKRYMAQGTLRVAAQPPTDIDHPSNGHITFIDNSVDQTTGTIKMKGTFPNDDHQLWPGQFVNVILTLTTDPSAVVIPSAAVQTGQQGQFVFVVKADMTVDMRTIDIARTNGVDTVIRGGLQARRDDRHRWPASPRAGQPHQRQGRQRDQDRVMNLSEVFIKRPVTTTLIMLGILVFGVMAYRQLPVSDLPPIDFPTIQVQAGLPGASPETIASSVALPLEKQFASIAGLQNINSTSQQGSTNITLQFDLSRNIDAAAQDVQSMIGRAARQLPPQMPAPPSYQKVNPGDQPVFFIVLSSPTLPMSQLDEYAQQTLAQRISMVNGVAQVDVQGSQKFAVRIDADPRKLAAHSIGIDDLAMAITNANVNLPTGTIYGDKTFVVQANGQLMRAAAYGPTIIAYRNGAPVRLEEVAHVFDGVENDKTASWQNDDRCIFLSVRKQPGTNVVEVVDGIKALVPTFRDQLPPSVTLAFRSDRSVPIRESVRDVKLTLLITIGLVIFVIFLFLRNLSATVIPSLALPASIIATFTVMYKLNYSLDNLSLMALTLSVGFVVDDAIVMLENIVRHMEMGKSAMQASYDASKEIAFTILSMTISLAAVFIPVLFMGGIVGRLLHEFSVTIGVAILVSGFVSVSLTPMLCSRFLKPPQHSGHGFLYNAFERMFDSWLRLYDRTLRISLRFRLVTMAVSIALLVGTGYLFTIVPKGFLPSEDQGRFNVNVEAVQGVGFDDMVRYTRQAAAIVNHDPNVLGASVNVGFGGNGGSNTGRMFVEMKPRAERKLSVDQTIAELRPQLAQVPGVRVYLTNQPPINLGGNNGSRAVYQFTLQDTDTAELYKFEPLLEDKIKQLPGVEDVSSDLLLKNPQVSVDMDRDKVSALGLSANDVETALFNAYGTRQVSQIYAANNQYNVILQVDPQFQHDPAAMSLLYVRSPAGQLIPLESLARMKTSVGPFSAQPQRPAAVRDDFVQPEARRRARRRGRSDSGHLRVADAADNLHELPGRRAGLPGLPAGPRPDSRDGDRRHLHRPRRALRELHAPADDSLGPAVGRLRRAADAADLQDGAESLRLCRHHHARRPREEERHHDGRLRRRRTAAARQDAARSDSRSLPRALPSDHDDDDGGAGRDVADRDGPGRWR